jgi:putative transposase
VAFGELWHHRSVTVFVQVILRLLDDLAGLVVLSVRPRRSVEAENLSLRRELALYQQRGAKPRRVDAATRASLAFLSRLFDWRDALVAVRPETLMRWHRAGWRLFSCCKSRPGRPPIPLELRQLIMATENPLGARRGLPTNRC